MEYRELGQTGLNVSALSFGASSLGNVFRKVNEADGLRTVHTCIDLGINLIDVSPYYGLTLAETRVLEALSEGLHPNDIATRYGVGISTIRSQIGSIRLKTRSDSIGALVRQVAVLPPLVGALRSVPVESGISSSEAGDGTSWSQMS